MDFRISKGWRSREVHIGKLRIGGSNSIIIQSMTNTDNLDIRSTVKQCERMIASGCEIIRFATPSIKDVAAIKEIKTKLRNAGIKTPLVADVHFNPKIACEAAKVVEKVRINPGNFVKSKKDYAYSDKDFIEEKKQCFDEFSKLVNICIENRTAIRIGANHGSLSPRMLYKYGDTVEGLVESVMEFVRFGRKLDFHQMILSLKSSNVKIMIEAYLRLVEKQMQEGYDYPLHLGVTEAGFGQAGRIKSAVGIGTLLKNGIGDTIRVSLTENPENEIVPARQIIAFCKKNADDTNDNQWMISSAIKFGAFLLNDKSYPIHLESKSLSKQRIKSIEEDILQACRIKQFKTEIISCPSCSRTLFDIQKISKIVEEEFRHLKHLKIAVMGCIVNGPGEMADADYGYVGSAMGMVNLYKGHKIVARGIPEEDAISELKKIIDFDLKKEPYEGLKPS